MKPFIIIFLFYLQYTISELPVTKIIKNYGYYCEEHTVQTEDGYILSLQRIPYSKNYHGKTKGVIFFQHGLADTSIGFCLNPPGIALPYILSDNGYDIWLGNNRGNGYSMKHINYSIEDVEFWNFSWDEMAKYDLPAQIHYVLKYTNSTSIAAYIGHSEGTIQAFAGFLDKQLASNVKLFIALAPVAYVGNIESLLVTTLAKLNTEYIFELLGIKEFDLPYSIQKLLPGICKINPQICEFNLNILMGPSKNLNISMLPFYLQYEPNPTSVKNMAHWAQGVRAGKFQQFDYGTEGNWKHYHQATPPIYNLNNFPKNLPVTLITGAYDYLADPRDVMILMSQLPYIHIETSYAHLDPIWSFDAHKKIYPIILQQIEKYLLSAS
jgi:lysosomal acid lipase/cholesteryl ester hydrolase